MSGCKYLNYLNNSKFIRIVVESQKQDRFSESSGNVALASSRERV